MTQLLYIIKETQISQNNHPIKKRSPKIINSLNILKQVFYKLKHTNRRMTQRIMLIPKIMSQFQVTTKMILIKNTS